MCLMMIMIVHNIMINLLKQADPFSKKKKKRLLCTFYAASTEKEKFKATRVIHIQTDMWTH
jgi:hypothetical protein